MLEKARALLAVCLARLLGNYNRSLLEAATVTTSPEALLEPTTIEEPKNFNPDRVRELFQKEGFMGLAKALKPFADGMDVPNKKLFGEVLVLMEANMGDVKLLRSDFAGRGKIRAVTSIPRRFEDSNPPSITLNEDWAPENGVDLVLAVHELGHVVDVKKDKTALDKVTWEKIYGAPGNSVEIRTELKAWELQLVLLNQLAGGLLDAFYEEILKASGQSEAKEISVRYTAQISEKLNIKEAQKGMLERWLQIYFNYKSPERFGVDCRWMYDFACQIAAEYEREGVLVYELALDKKDQKSDPTRCIDPLPDGPYDYKVYFPYAKSGKTGTVAPSSGVRF